jgi:two-component system, response regulator, stage 0 sporulation protein F
MPQDPRTLRVLVIDDEPDNRSVVMDLLRDYGIGSLAEATDVTARTVFDQFHPDVVVIDIAMPTEDGTQIAAWVRKEHPDVRVVVYTAFTNVGNIKLLIDAVGAHAFLQKPFDADDLYKAVVGG